MKVPKHNTDEQGKNFKKGGFRQVHFKSHLEKGCGLSIVKLSSRSCSGAYCEQFGPWHFYGNWEPCIHPVVVMQCESVPPLVSLRESLLVINLDWIFSLHSLPWFSPVSLSLETKEKVPVPALGKLGVWGGGVPPLISWRSLYSPTWQKPAFWPRLGWGMET